MARLVAFVIALVAQAGALGAQPSSTPRAEAYYQFLLGRHLESEGKIDRAVAAHREAARLAPGSAEVRAELAGLFARQGQAQDAVDQARAALAIDPTNREANRVLGSVLASAVDEAGTPDQARLGEAIGYLEKGRRTDGIDVDPTLELSLARLYLRAGQPDKAVATVTTLLVREPMDEGWLLLAQAHTAAGRADRAAEALEQGAQFNPRLYVSLGELYERQQRWDLAAGAYEKATSISPRSSELKLRWATALLNAPSDAGALRARQLLEEVVAAQPTDDRPLYLLSQAERRLKDYAAAEASARRVIALDPSGLWGPYALASVYEDRREYRKVVETLAPAAAAWKPSPSTPTRQGLQVLTHLGFAQMQLGSYDEAIATFERARGLARDDGTYDLYLAQANLNAKRYEAARRLLQPLRAARPDDPRLAQLDARALVGAGRREDAIAVLRSAVGANPNEASSYLSLADLLAKGPRLDEAMRVLDEAARRFPDSLEVPFQRGALLERAKEPERAEHAFREVLERDPLHAQALNYLGYMFAERGERLDEAVQLIERALKIDPDNGSYLDSLGWALYKQRNYERAREYLTRAADQLPANSVVQDHLGDALAALGRYDAAVAAWRLALGGDRESIDVTAIERKIERAREQAAR